MLQQRFVTPRRFGHEMVQTLAHRLDALRSQTRPIGSMLLRSPGSSNPLQ
jgi:hypothetical protein